MTCAWSVRCTGCDSTDDDGSDGTMTSSSLPLIDHGYAEHPQLRPRSLEAASNGFLINVNNDDDTVNR